MNTIHDLLNDADPVTHESPVIEEQRDKSRALVAAAALAETRKGQQSRFRLARLSIVIGVSVAVIGVLILGTLLWPRMGFETHARVRFEVRLAEDRPAPGLIEAPVSGTDRTIYLHPEIVLSNEDVAVARVSKDVNARVAISLTFTTEGTKKMQAATGQRIGKPLAILIDGIVVLTPRLNESVSNAAIITGMTSDDAERIANGMK